MVASKDKKPDYYYMPELAPLITYSPDQVLEIRDIATASEISPLYVEHLEELDQKQGYEIAHDGEDVIIRVQIDEVIDRGDEVEFNNPSALAIIEAVNLFAYPDLSERRDHVFSVGLWDGGGLRGTVYTQFQRWLESGSLDEEVARRCFQAMAQPFGKDAERQAKKLFSFKADDTNVVAGPGNDSFGLTSRHDEFVVIQFEKTGSEVTEKDGRLQWHLPSLTTLGECACLFVEGDNRTLLLPTKTQLYHLSPHNIRFATQSLSLVLGVASLAYEAANYPGQEDIFAEISWVDEAAT